MTAKKIHIGTSGWLYDHWRGIFYPEGLPRNRWFEHYKNFFTTVELNVTYYRLPSERTFESWKRKAPEGFLYSVKGWGLITHRKKLKNVEENLNLFLSRVKILGENLGIVFFQTPPIMGKDIGRLRDFLELLIQYGEFRFAIEFRHSSWFDEDVKELLSRYETGFVQFHHPELPCPRWRTTRYVYIRMHGKGLLYGGAYDEEDLYELAEYIRTEDADEIFVYFNNDAHGHAVRNALKLKEIL